MVGAIQVPEDAPDGLYTAQLSEGPKKREPELVLITEYNTTATTPVKARSNNEGRELPVSLVECNPSPYMLDGVNYQQAMAELGNWCDQGQGLQSNSGLFSKVGSALVYGCSWGGYNPCSGGEVLDAMSWLDGGCGNLWSAHMEMKDWKKLWGGP
jgi:hypothetical protein